MILKYVDPVTCTGLTKKFPQVMLLLFSKLKVLLWNLKKKKKIEKKRQEKKKEKNNSTLLHKFM